MPKNPASDQFQVDSVALVIGYKTKKGIEEVVHQIDSKDVTIVSCQHGIVRKVKQNKAEDGSLLGFEPTGEEELTLKIKYIKE